MVHKSASHEADQFDALSDGFFLELSAPDEFYRFGSGLYSWGGNDALTLDLRTADEIVFADLPDLISTHLGQLNRVTASTPLYPTASASLAPIASEAQSVATGNVSLQSSDSAPTPVALAAAAAPLVADYYVSTAGWDGNKGTKASPFATITKAASAAGPGDVIAVAGGWYGDQVKVWKSGTSGNPITIQPDAGAHVIIDGWNTKANTDLVAITASYINFQGFEVRNATKTGVSVWNGHDVNISGNVVHETRRSGIWIGADKEGLSYNLTIDDNAVYRTVLENNARNAGSGWSKAVSVDLVKNATISNNTVFDNFGEGIGSLSSSKLYVKNNVAYDNYSAQTYFDNSQSVYVNSNKIFQTGNSDYYRSGKAGIGVLIANEYTSYQKASTDYHVTGNTFAGVTGAIYDSSYGWGGGLSGSELTSNTSMSSYNHDWLYDY